MSLQRRVASLAAVAWFAGVLAAAPPAAAGDLLDWRSLRPAVVPADNPFERLTPQQTEWITEIARGRLLEQRGLPADSISSAREAELAAALAAEGLDAEELLRQRDALIAQRRAAAEAPAPDVAGRDVRLLGHLVPASADGATVTDWLFVPWGEACSHATPPANQIVRIPAEDLADADLHGSQLLVLTGRLGMLEQESRLRLVDGEVPLRSAYVIAGPTLTPPPSFARIHALPGAPSR